MNLYHFYFAFLVLEHTTRSCDLVPFQTFFLNCTIVVFLHKYQLFNTLPFMSLDASFFFSITFKITENTACTLMYSIHSGIYSNIYGIYSGIYSNNKVTTYSYEF